MNTTILQHPAVSDTHCIANNLLLKKPLTLIILLLILSSGIQAQVTREWYKTYNDTLNTTNHYCSNDCMKVMAIDIEGNVYVSGICYYNTYEFKMVTVKYNTAGNKIWRAVYPSVYGFIFSQPNAIKVDKYGNVYIAALYRISNYSDYAVIKYNSNGLLAWSKIYNGTGQYIDTPFGIAVDDAGDIYVTGKSYKSSDFDIVTIKYNSAGVQQWIADFDSPEHLNDIPGSIFLDCNGDIVIGGSSSAVNADGEMCFIKYNRYGLLKWYYIFDNNSCNDEFNSMAADPSGNIFAAGSTSLSSNDTRVCTIKIDTLGRLMWSKMFNRTDGYIINLPASIGVDKNNNVYVAGISEKDYTNIDFLTIKYNQDGTEQWHKYYNNSFQYTAKVSGLKVDTSGNSYITGFAVENDYGYTTIKYDRNGILKWHARYEQAGSETDCFPLIEIDNNNNIFVSGMTDEFNAGMDYLLIKYHQEPDTTIIEPVSPTVYEIFQNYPNPFNPGTNFEFDLPERALVNIKVFDISGKEITTVINREYEAGRNIIKWNAVNLSSGIYFYRFNAGSYTITKKMILYK